MFNYIRPPFLKSFSQLLFLCSYGFLGCVAGGLPRHFPDFQKRSLHRMLGALEIDCKPGNSNIHCQRGLSIAGQLNICLRSTGYCDANFISVDQDEWPTVCQENHCYFW